MDLYLIIIIIISGAFCAFCSSIISSLTIDELSIINSKKTKRTEKLSEIKFHFDEWVNSFLIFEVLLYIIAGILLGINYSYLNYPIYLLILSAFFLFLSTILLRTFFIAIGIRFSSKLALMFTPVISSIIFLGKPLVSLISKIIIGIGGENAEEASREEINALVETAREDGSLDPDEYRILKSIMHFSEVLVSDVMTPRTVVYASEADRKVIEVVNQPELRMYSRFPIWEGASLDGGIIGYVLTKDVLHAALAGKLETKLRSISREVYFIPENASLDTALDSFLKRRQHLFVVVDEYGGFEGLLTMEDVLETILGAEIVDEADKVVDLRELAKQRRDKRIAIYKHQDEIKVD